MFGPVGAVRGAQMGELSSEKGGKSGVYIINEQVSSEFSDDDNFSTAFNDAKIRSKFVFKVYSILAVQLAFTTLCNLPFLMIDEVQEFATDYPWIMFFCVAVFFVPYFMLVCCENTRRKFPTNVILLFIMTLGMAGVCGFCTAKWDTEIVIYAFVLTVVVSVTATIMAVICPFDFTSCTMTLSIMTVVVGLYICVASALIIIFESKLLHIISMGLIIIMFTMFLIFDTQAIIGGHRVSLNPEEYILGAVQLYVDIIEIFLNFLEMVGACTESD